MEDLPFWVRVLSALATPAIALLGFAIAWGQWTTARSKLMLDLFERRRAVYSAFRGPAGRAVSEGQADSETYSEFFRIIDEAQFLFGRDVMDFIGDHRQQLYAVTILSSMLQTETVSDAKRKEVLDKRHDALVCLAEFFYPELAKRMIPYMLMDQKRPWTPSRIPRWFGWRWRQLRKAIAKWWSSGRKKRDL